jgi:hypothetical protein
VRVVSGKADALLIPMSPLAAAATGVMGAPAVAAAAMAMVYSRRLRTYVWCIMMHGAWDPRGTFFYLAFTL